MSVLSRGIARLSRRKKKQRDLPAIIEQDHNTTPDLIPRHLEVADMSKPSLLGRSMDRLRRSIRQSFRRNRSIERNPPALVTVPDGTGGSAAWQPDETAVRAGVCSFPVKYLGATEVYESRGMPICEGALKHLRSLKRQPVKAILYVSGDGLRVVDQENSRGLMVDQTIEKVSFCAPDRNNDKGFAYICRDGTTRRWMCHGFHASKDSGERLSHAVGCAFAICLEKKKKRDEDNMFAADKPVTVEKALNPDWGDKEAESPVPPTNGTANPMQRTNNAYQSFRKQMSISERLQDPQSVIVNEAPSSSTPQNQPSIAKPRPAANPALFQRQGSLRAPESSQNNQFRRNFSLRTTPGEIVSNRGFGTVLNNEPIYEGDEDNLVSLAPTASTAIPQYANVPNFNQPFGQTSTAPVQTMNNPAPSVPQIQQQKSVDLLNFNDISDFNKPITVNTQYSPTVPALPSASSRADDWLNSTLKSSMSFSSPPEMTPSPSMSSMSNGRSVNSNVYSNVPSAVESPRSGPPPTSAPPPIPQRPPGVVSAPVAKQITQLNGMNPASMPNGTDAFGQQINWETTSPRHIPKPEDPFDIQWSKMAISSNNPFATDQQRIIT